MKDIVSIIFLSFLIGSCSKPTILKNGLTKETFKVTDLIIKINLDTLNTEIHDTISKTEKFFNNNNQIVKTINEMFFDDRRNMIIDIVYDNSQKIQKEIVKLQFDTSIVYYNYNEDQLTGTSTNSNHEKYDFSQTTKNLYNSQNRLSQISTTQIYFDKEVEDTIGHRLRIDLYDRKEKLKETQITDFNNPEKSKRIKYKYHKGRLSKIIDFDYKDSLLVVSSFTYIFDEHNNWIERRTIENNQLQFIKKRDIVYR